MDTVEDVDIDGDGTFKYILIKVSTTGDNPTSKLIVRGYSWAGYHADIFEEVEPTFTATGLTCECVGGGRIMHNSSTKTIKVYGYSVGFGQANHSKTCVILSKKYSGYPKDNITWSNEGY